MCHVSKVLGLVRNVKTLSILIDQFLNTFFILGPSSQNGLFLAIFHYLLYKLGVVTL